MVFRCLVLYPVLLLMLLIIIWLDFMFSVFANVELWKSQNTFGSLGRLVNYLNVPILMCKFTIRSSYYEYGGICTHENY